MTNNNRLLAKKEDSSFRKQKTIELIRFIKYINGAVAKSTAERDNSKLQKAQHTPTSVFFIVYLLTHLSYLFLWWRSMGNGSPLAGFLLGSVCHPVLRYRPTAVILINQKRLHNVKNDNSR